MEVHPRERTEGQTLIQVALLMVVLLGFVALAIDGGLLYQERRRMQNAADAGALAGAREICFGTPGNWSSAATSYAQQNGAEGVVPTLVNYYTVSVTVSETVNSLVAGIIGVDTSNVGAKAAAVCGSATKACGLWPIGFSQSRWNDLYDYGDGCGKPFYVWNGDNETGKVLDCVTTHDCDLDDDGRDDVVVDAGRGWLDFSDVTNPLYPSCANSGCGEPELACWISNNSTAPITLGDACVPGANGVKAGVKDEINARNNANVGVPLYDYTGCAGISCPGGTTYHISGLGCITVGDGVVGHKPWDQNFEVLRKDGSNPSWKGKVVIARVNCTPNACATECGSAGGPPIPSGVNAVSLIE